MTSILKPITHTPEEYLNLELLSPERHEYLAGEIKLMTGETPNHNEIVSNLLVALKLSLKGQAYQSFVSDQRLWIPEKNLYLYY